MKKKVFALLYLLLTLAVFLVLASVFVFLWPTLKTARYWHKNDRYLNDFSEKGVVLILDEVPSP